MTLTYSGCFDASNNACEAAGGGDTKLAVMGALRQRWHWYWPGEIEQPIRPLGKRRIVKNERTVRKPGDRVAARGFDLYTGGNSANGNGPLAWTVDELQMPAAIPSGSVHERSRQAVPILDQERLTAAILVDIQDVNVVSLASRVSNERAPKYRQCRHTTSGSLLAA
jgi:hypothetical protein